MQGGGHGGWMMEAGALRAGDLAPAYLIAYTGGDEAQGADPAIAERIRSTFGAKGQDLLGELLLGIWNDDTPDRDVSIELATAAIAPR